MPTLVLYKKGSRKKHYRKNEIVMFQTFVTFPSKAMSDCGLEVVFSHPKTFGHQAQCLVAPLTFGFALLEMYQGDGIVDQLNAEALLRTVGEILGACKKHPNASIRVEGLNYYLPGHTKMLRSKLKGENNG